MTAKLTLKPAPTFTAPAPIVVPGQAEPVPVPMTFRHRTKSQLIEWEKDKPKRGDVQTFLDMVVGWGLVDEVPDTTPPQEVAVPFTEENVAAFLENYPGAALATYFFYVDELFRARRKN